MGLFRRSPRSVRLEQPHVEIEAVGEPSTLWTDGLGRLAVRSVQVIVVVALAAGIILGLRAVSIVVIPLVIALIFASAFAPVMAWLRRRGVPSVLATLIVLFAVLGALGLLGWLIVEAVQDQWADLYQQAQEGIDEFTSWVDTLPFAPSADQLDQAREQIVAFLTSAQFGSGALAGVGAVASFLTGLVLMAVILFFFLKDGPQMWTFLLRPFRGENHRRAERIGRKTVSVLGAYVRGTASVAFVDAVGIYIALLILQVPLALPLAVLVFLLAFIPIVGATLAGALAALVALVANDWVNALFVVGAVVLVNQLEGNFLQPVLMGRSVKLNSFVVLVALAAGTAIGGILGTLLAVPITATAWGIVQVWDGENTPARWARPKRRERAAAAESG